MCINYVHSDRFLIPWEAFFVQCSYAMPVLLRSVSSHNQTAADGFIGSGVGAPLFPGHDQERIEDNYSIAGPRSARDRGLRLPWDSTANLSCRHRMFPGDLSETKSRQEKAALRQMRYEALQLSDTCDCPPVEIQRRTNLLK